MWFSWFLSWFLAFAIEQPTAKDGLRDG